MEIKNPKAEYRRLVKLEIEMRKMHRAAIYDKIFSADLMELKYFEGYTKALEIALKMTPKDILAVVDSIKEE